MTQQHTPGPWSTEADSRPSDFWGALYGNESLKPLALIEHYGGEKTDAANARLIAAAPLLLEAAEAVIGGWGQYYAIHVAQNYRRMTSDQIEAGSKRFTDGLEALQAAIAQTTGKE